MMRSLFSGVSGLKNHQTAMDVVGNNVANVNTTAFKASSVIFQDIVNQTISAASAPSAAAGGTGLGGQNSKQVGLGMSVSAISKDMTEGSTQSTDRPLDFAIQGEGYFVVKNVDGTDTYTRNGNFTLSKDGYLVTANGQYVMGLKATSDTDESNLKNGASATGYDKIQLLGTLSGDANSTYSGYAVDKNGKITATKTTVSGGTSTSKSVTVGRLVLATFNNAAGLDANGESCYNPSSNSGDAVYSFVGDKSAGVVESGKLEMSNVSLATEMTNMIIFQRGFQANSRVITTSDTMLEELVNLKR